MLTPGLKKLAVASGGIIVILSLALIALQFHEQWSFIYAKLHDSRLLGFLALLAFVYAILNFLLASAWLSLLSGLSGKKIPISFNNSVYAKSIIAKYIPGNTMQIVSRHIMLNIFGIEHKTLLLASFLEIAILLASAMSIMLLGYAVSYNETGFYQQFLGYLLLLLIVYRSRFKIMSAMKKYRPLNNATFNIHSLPKSFLYAFLKYFSFFTISSLLLLMLILAITPNADIYFSEVLGIYAVSWLAGFITPGAPSGIGVRESLIIFLMADIGNTADGLLVATLFRLVTISGDLLFFLMTLKKITTETNQKEQPCQ